MRSAIRWFKCKLKPPKKEEKKCKGIKKVVVSKHLSFQDYKDCLERKQNLYKAMNVIRSHKHTLWTEEVNKIALSADDDKRIIKNDGISLMLVDTKKLEIK